MLKKIFFILIIPNYIYCFDKISSTNTMFVNDSLIISRKNIKKIIVIDSKIIKVNKSNENSIIITAKKKGKTSKHVKKKDNKNIKYDFNILSYKINQRLLYVKEALKHLKGIKINNIGDYIQIYGKIFNKQDQKLIKKITKSNSKILNYSKLIHIKNNFQYNELTYNLMDLGLYDIDIKNLSNIIFVEASSRNKNNIAKVKYFMKKTFPNSRLDIKLIPYQVDIDVKILEISKNQASSYGINLPKTINVTRHTIFSQIELDSIINAEDVKKRAKILYNPSLSSNDGETATFHAGGSIPIKLSSRFSSNLSWKNYGVILKFTPFVINDNTVEIDISSEFSSAGSTKSEQSIPSFIVRKVNTKVTVETGKSIVISGLIQKTKELAQTGIPILSQIPILSALFSVKENIEENTELLIIVTPELRFRCEEQIIDQQLDELLIEAIEDSKKTKYSIKKQK